LLLGTASIVWRIGVISYFGDLSRFGRICLAIAKQ
jgi:hypothetical protein